MSELFICPQCRREYLDPEVRFCTTDGSPIFRPESLARVGQRLDSYELMDILGEGGMGVVYRGRHVLLDKPVAIKILHQCYADKDGAVEQFLQEARAASRIRHPNIVDVTDFGRGPDGCVFLVMEHLEGISLDEVLASDGWLPVFKAVNIVRQMSHALAAAHEEGIVHRDLKPENVFLVNREGRRRVVRMVRENETQRFVVEKEGTFDFVKLLDFGVAKFLQVENVPSSSTRAGMVFGTPHYMSPEQARGLPVDGRSDLYSLGILFYEMVTGVIPFDGKSALDILNGHVYSEVIPPTDRNPYVTIDEGTNRTILHCLEKDPRDRFQTMDDLLVALQDCFTDQVFLRDASRLPGALEAGIVVPETPEPSIPGLLLEPEPEHEPPARRKAGSLTQELSELFWGAEEPTPEVARRPTAPAPTGQGGLEVLEDPDPSVLLLQPRKAKDLSLAAADELQELPSLAEEHTPIPAVDEPATPILLTPSRRRTPTRPGLGEGAGGSSSTEDPPQPAGAQETDHEVDRDRDENEDRELDREEEQILTHQPRPGAILLSKVQPDARQDTAELKEIDEEEKTQKGRPVPQLPPAGRS